MVQKGGTDAVPLNMTRPYRHPKTGMYWVRKAVPGQLRDLVGKHELKRSLHTKDPREAKQLALAVIAEFEQQLNRARMAQQFGPQELKALEGVYYRDRRSNLLEQARRGNWDASLWLGQEAAHEAVLDASRHPSEDAAVVRDWGAPHVDALAKRFNITPTPAFRDALSEALYIAEGAATADARAEHQDYRLVPERPYPAFKDPAARSLSTLFSMYAKARPLPSSTAEQWGKLIQHFEGWLQGKPADRVSQPDVQRYVDAVRAGGGLSGRPLSAKRVNEGYLAAIRRTYAWAVKRGYLADNPAKGASVDARPEEKGQRRRAYERGEVASILLAARQESTPYKRWVPWLLAFTGARVSEVLNARKADIGQTEGIAYIYIRRAGGTATSAASLKNTWSVRCVPLHPAVLAEGFLGYAEGLPEGAYLFPGDWKDKHGNRTKTPANRLRDWIHRIVPAGDGIAPNHSFRHWLVSECKRARIDPDHQRQLTGHSIRDVHGSYGPADVPVLMEALQLIPSPVASS
ncbi:MAG: hypothetical protein FKY71_13200 [Spiribacter salinus]|uniref:Tyr recombinase domain-containing protein n=1 Tax=Spiribacter salinus TaxID=1335746 RepID=A0A540VP78_9GAMM|nr:MAG: hypothetical protein FKY71_13200 [Spiribacter salinus]